MALVFNMLFVCILLDFKVVLFVHYIFIAEGMGHMWRSKGSFRSWFSLHHVLLESQLRSSRMLATPFNCHLPGFGFVF